MKTLVIQRGDRLEIRAIASPTNEPGVRDKCAVLAFFQEQARIRPGEMEKLATLLRETARSGPPANDTKFKDLPGTSGLYEFKTSGGLRVLCFWDEGSLIVCTHGYVKGSQKTPTRDIDRADRLKRDYFNAKGNGELVHAQGKR